MSRWIHEEGLNLNRGMSNEDLDELFAYQQQKFRQGKELEKRIKDLALSFGNSFEVRWERNPKYYEWNGSFNNAPEVKVVVINDIIIPFDDMHSICRVLFQNVSAEVLKHYLDFLVEGKGMLINHPYKNDNIPTNALAKWVDGKLLVCYTKGVHFPLDWEITPSYTQGTQSQWAVSKCFSDWVLENI